MYENFLTTQGAGITIVGTLRDPDDKPILNVYNGSEGLVTTIWPGGPRPASFMPATTWILPPASTFQAAITSAQTATIHPGVYQGVTRIADAGDNADAFYFELTVAPGPGGIPATPTSTAITRLVVEVELVDRDSALLLLCGKSITADGANRHLTGSIGFALACLGFTPAIPGVVSDADLAVVPASKFFLLCDLAEYRLLKNLLSSFAQPDQTSGNNKIQLNAMMKRFRDQMIDLEKQYAAYLGTARAILSHGSIQVRRPSQVQPWTSWDRRGSGGDF